MAMTVEQIIGARDAALANKALAKELRRMHRRKNGMCAEERILSLRAWVYHIAEGLSRELGEVNETTERLVEAMRLGAVGDPLAERESAKARAEGFESDACGYVEDGFVYLNVWMGGNNPKRECSLAKKTAEEFRKAGYSTEVWADNVEESDDGVYNITVFAKKDFAEYCGNKAK